MVIAQQNPKQWSQVIAQTNMSKVEQMVRSKSGGAKGEEQKERCKRGGAKREEQKVRSKS